MSGFQAEEKERGWVGIEGEVDTSAQTRVSRWVKGRFSRDAIF
jgi:hypothetical protein